MIDGTLGYICTVPMIYEPFVTSLVQLVQYNQAKGINVWYNRTTIGSQAIARNDLVKQMRGDWLFFLDTDIVLPCNSLEKLLEILNKNNIDVLSGIYYQRQAPHSPIVYHSEDEEIWNYNPNFHQSEIVPVFAVGGGCLLVRRKVFDRIKKELNEEPFDIIASSGEDISFCRRLKKLNIPIYGTNQIKVGHLSLQPITESTFQKKAWES